MEVPRYWRLKKQRYLLVGETCPTCASYLFPPRAVCPICLDRAREMKQQPERQQIYAMAEPTQTISH